ENGNIRCPHATARFRDVRNLVRYGGSAFTIPAERYARYVLHVWRTVYPAIASSSRPTTDSFRGHRGFGSLSPSFRPDVDHRETAKPREGCLARHEHRLLVVLQQSRCEHSGGHRAVRSLPRRA